MQETIFVKIVSCTPKKLEISDIWSRFVTVCSDFL